MSRVIKAPVFKEDALVIATPRSKSAPEPEEKEPAVDPEEYARMMAALEEKEKQVEHMLEATKRSCDLMMQDAEERHVAMLDQAKGEIAVLREEEKKAGHEEGFQQGLVDGKEQAMQDMQDAIREANERAEHILKVADEATGDYLKQAEHQIAEVVMTVVEKILPQHFIDVPQVVLPLVRENILKVCDQKKVEVHVHPESYEIVLMARDEFRALLTGGGADLQIVSDESLQPGDCVIETSNGTLDARLATQIELIRNAVQEILP